MGDYEKRICLVCGNEFEPLYAAQITCPGQCRKKRNSIRSQKYRLKRKAYVAGLEQALQEKEAIIESLQKEVKDLKAQLKNFEQAKTKSSPAGDFMREHELQTCERMNLRAIILPCGEREECWHPQKCKKNTHIVKPEKISKSTVRIYPNAEFIEELP